MIINVSDKLLKNLGLNDFNHTDTLINLYCFNIIIHQDSKNTLLNKFDYLKLCNILLNYLILDFIVNLIKIILYNFLL